MESIELCSTPAFSQQGIATPETSSTEAAAILSLVNDLLRPLARVAGSLINSANRPDGQS